MTELSVDSSGKIVRIFTEIIIIDRYIEFLVDLFVVVLLVSQKERIRRS